MSFAGIAKEKLKWLAEVSLAEGSHLSPEEGVCAMEAAAYLAGEPHSDKPECVCPVIGAFVRQLNDGLPGEVRDEVLKPLIPRLLGTLSTLEAELKRGFMAADWAVRVVTPLSLDSSSLAVEATRLRRLSEIVDEASVKSARAAAAGAAAAGAAAARAAAAGAAAARAAAAGAAPAKVDLAASAQDLIRRMIAVGKEEIAREQA